MTKNFLKKYFLWCIVAVVIVMSTPRQAMAIKEPTYEYTDETANIYAYVVDIIADIEVLDAPGYENNKVYYNGEQLVLKAGDRVAGMNSITTAYTELWYEVRWVEENVEFHGYIYSGYRNGKWTTKYAEMSSEAAMNIPTPTPTPTNTPTPTPTNTPTPSPTPVPVQEKSEFPIIPFVVIIGVMVALAAAAYYYFVETRKQQTSTKSEDQIKRLKNVLDRDSVVEREKQLYENVAGGTKASNKETLGQGVYTVQSREEEGLTDPNDYEDDRLKKIAQNVKEKEIIRRELEALDARDMVYHKYFGEGQVVDNSDVNNVEVKFVNHGIMYIDKEEAARKALMRKL